MSEDVKLLRAVHGSARANGGEAFGRVTFRLNKNPEARWRELFAAAEGQGITTEERGSEFLLHVAVKPGEVAAKRDALRTLISEVNDKRRAELTLQADQARERSENKRSIEDALNQELEALKFD